MKRYTRFLPGRDRHCKVAQSRAPRFPDKVSCDRFGRIIGQSGPSPIIFSWGLGISELLLVSVKAHSRIGRAITSCSRPGRHMLGGGGCRCRRQNHE
ncbi:hypothetical protein VTK56DRAFT_8640 [Thermocarpiscus australiensis]